MKVLATILSYFKYVLLPPFAALLIWVYTSFASSLLNYYPKLIELLDSQLKTWDASNHTLSDATVLETFYLGLRYIIGFLEKIIVSLNYWLPVEIMVNVAATAILISLSFAIFRIFVKFVTVGQI